MKTKPIKQKAGHALLGVLILLAGCGRNDPKKLEASYKSSEKGRGDYLVQINGKKIAEDHYTRQAFHFVPLSRLQMDRPDERLQALIESELLYQDALKKKLDQRPHIRRQIQQLVMNELLNENLPPEHRPEPILEEEAQAYYNENIDNYHTPAAVHIAHILLVPSAGQNPESVRQEAEDLLKNPILHRPAGFRRFVQKHSHDKQSAIRGGKLGAIPLPDGVSDPKYESWVLQLAKAANDVKKIGQLVDHVIETERGYHLVKLTGRTKAQIYTFNDVRKKIARRLLSEHRAIAYRKQIDALKKQAEILINQDRADALKNASSPTLLAQQKKRAARDLEKRSFSKKQIEAETEPWNPEPVAHSSEPDDDEPLTLRNIPRTGKENPLLSITRDPQPKQPERPTAQGGIRSEVRVETLSESDLDLQKRIQRIRETALRKAPQTGSTNSVD